MKNPVLNRREVTGLWYICGGATVLFALLAVLVASGVTTPADTAILTWFNTDSRPWLDVFFVTMTDFGGFVAVTIATVLLCGLLLYKRLPRKALLVALGVGGAALIGVLLKGLFERPRPDLWEWLVTETYFSFPSGHAVASSALALSLIAVCWHSRWRTAAIVGGALYTLIIGLSRLYLGVHFPTDILGGWILSTAWVSFISVLIFGVVWSRRKKTGMS